MTIYNVLGDWFKCPTWNVGKLRCSLAKLNRGSCSLVSPLFPVHFKNSLPESQSQYWQRKSGSEQSNLGRNSSLCSHPRLTEREVGMRNRWSRPWITNSRLGLRTTTARAAAATIASVSFLICYTEITTAACLAKESALALSSHPRQCSSVIRLTRIHLNRKS